MSEMMERLTDHFARVRAAAIEWSIRELDLSPAELDVAMGLGPHDAQLAAVIPAPWMDPRCRGCWTNVSE